MIKPFIKAVLRSKGLKIVPLGAKIESPYRNMSHPHSYMEDEFITIWKRWQKIMMRGTFNNSLYTTYKALRFIIKNNVEGDIVESGVYEGAQCVMAALTLQTLGDTSRKIYMYDTYRGMPEPTEKDFDHNKGQAAEEKFKKLQSDGISEWNASSLEATKKNMQETGYNLGDICMIEGLVQDTVPNQKPQKISLLRLDTDFYDSTSAEMRELYPLLSKKGVFLVDGYGRWEGQKQAIDEYFTSNGLEPLLLRSGYNDWVSVKN